MEITGKKLVFIAFMMALAFGFTFSRADARVLLQPKGATIPRLPSGYYSFSRDLNFGKLPKGVPIPPSGSSTRWPPEGPILPKK